LQSSTAIATGLVGIWLVYSHTTRLDGWTQYELLAVVGVFTIMGGIINAIISPNMQKLLDDIQQGNFDFVLTKPEDPQLIISVRQISIWQLVDVLTGLVVLVFAIANLRSSIGPAQALSFALVLLLGVLMVYCFWLLLTTVAFWVVRMENVIELFQGIYAAGRYPVGIYPGWLRIGLTFLVPIAFAVTIPAEALTGRLTLQTVLGAAGLALLLLAITRWFWTFGLRHYSGASA
jgi:ABC-2 type transport system permease protein